MILTIEEIKKNLKDKKISCVELVTSCFVKIKEDGLNDFIELYEEEALSNAKIVDQKIINNETLKELEGIPIAIKDNMLIKGKKATAGSKILENYIATYDASVVQKLKTAGAIIIGKTNLDEFAMGASNETSYFGPVLNPHDKTRVPGGSSGGSAAAVAAGHCCFSLGSDTGGSIRQPASFCGVVGLKPSYGYVSRYGLMALGSSLDQIGPITNSVEDTIIVLNLISGLDKQDMTSVDSIDVDIKKVEKPIKNMIVGIPKGYYELSIDQTIKEDFKENIEKLKSEGIKIKEVDLSFMDDCLAVYYILQPAEASTNLARYDGLKYGFNEKEVTDLKDNYFKNRANFGKEVKRRIMIGTYVLSAGYRDAYYNQSKKVQQDIKNRFKDIFDVVDNIILPTAPSKAFKLNEKMNDPVAMYLSDIFTVSANIAGLPAISIPMKVEANSLPAGIQVIGKSFCEESLLNLAYHLENNNKPSQPILKK